MAWDLRKALLKKGENESARLDEFEFRLRARTMRRLAESLGIDAAELVREVAQKHDDGLLTDLLAARPNLGETGLRRAYEQARAEARTESIEKYGDPATHRLV